MSNKSNQNGTAGAALTTEATATPDKGKINVNNPLPDLSKKIVRIAELQRLVNQRRNVQDFKDKLIEFKLSNEDEKMHLRFEDEERNRIETHNPVLIGRVQECLLKAMDEKLQELDSLLTESTL